MTDEAPKLLEVKGLKTYFDVEGQTAKAVDGVDFDVRENEVFGVVGESGSGKTVTALSILRLIPSPPGWIEAGEILFRGKDLTKLSFPEMRKIRGKEISMIFQEPMTALNPVFTVGFQMREVMKQHAPGTSRQELDESAASMLDLVGIPDAKRRLKSYPNEFSGGQRQRIMIAMALSLQPHLLVADEPTTALDVTIQAQILDLMLGLGKKSGRTSILLITHNLAVVAETCARVAVMYGGKVQEMAPTKRLFGSPQHPYTRGLMRSLPRPDKPKQRRLEAIPGIVPSVMDFPKGCKFWTRCAEKIKRCEEEEPELREVSPGHLCRCHLVEPAPAAKGESGATAP